MGSSLVNIMKNAQQGCICLNSEDCLAPKTIVCEENNTKIRFECKIENTEKEKILGIIIDPNFEGKCNGKKDCIYNLNFSGKICDGIIIFERKTDENSFLTKVIFFELKSSNVKKAVSQLLDTIENFKRKYPQHNYNNYKIGIIIAHTGSAPRLKPRLKVYSPKIGNGNGPGLDITDYIFNFEEE